MTVRDLVTLSSEDYHTYQLFLKSQANSASNSTTGNLFNFYLSLTDILFYFGWFIIICGICIFYVYGSFKYGKDFVFLGSVAYAAMFQTVGYHIWHVLDSKLFGGLLLMCAIIMVPIIVYTFLISILDKGDNYYFIRLFTEIATLTASFFQLYHYQEFTFFIAFITLVTWCLFIDIVCLNDKIRNSKFFNVCFRRMTELFGVTMICLAYYLDHQHQSNYIKYDYSFWLYIFGTIFSWIAITSENTSNSSLNHFLYGCLNIALILIWMFAIHRNVFLILGLIGITFYQLRYLGGKQISEFFLRNAESLTHDNNSVSYNITFNIMLLTLAYSFEVNQINQFLINQNIFIIDLTFWLYFVGSSMLWWDLSSELIGHTKEIASDFQLNAEFIKFVYLIFNLSYLAISIYLVRIIFLSYASIGITYYVSHIVNKVFNNTMAKSIGAIMFGISIMMCSQYIQTYYSI